MTMEAGEASGAAARASKVARERNSPKEFRALEVPRAFNLPGVLNGAELCAVATFYIPLGIFLFI